MDFFLLFFLFSDNLIGEGITRESNIMFYGFT